MKKATLLAMAAALFMGATAVAQQTQEVTYVQDPSQGYLFNRFKDNWFITVEGGIGSYFSPRDSNLKTKDRITPAAGLYVGKWFSPIMGLRVGASFLQLNDISEVQNSYTEPFSPNRWKEKFTEIGPAFDAMINLTNWWCGYKPGRVYNAILYAGAGGYFTFGKNQAKDKWENAHDFVLGVRAGLINSFNVSKQVAISLDLRFTAMDNHSDLIGSDWNKTAFDLQAYLGVTYLFKKREWSAPVVPVCPEPENCDALRARLEAAEGQIASLEEQLAACLNRPAEVIVEEAEVGPLATIYYPIGVYALTRSDKAVLGAVANVMKANPDKHYTLTGWADNYTGTESINVRLRHNRVNGVEKQLIRNGVPQSQITATINNGNLCDLGEKYVAFDRAVTIQEGN